jgi:hypothetical protein
MNETCDRCGPAVRAVYRVARNGELYLCRHCASQLSPALTAQGWSVRLAGEYALASQARRGRSWLSNLLPGRNSADWGKKRVITDRRLADCCR